MIKYRLICKSCNNLFDSWFASSNEFEKLKIRKLLTCHCCKSKKIDKTLMAPKIMNRSFYKIDNKKNSKINIINKKIKEYKKFIKNNFEYVGENFAYEARSIHYNEKKNNKGIFGSASNDEIKELREEGINAEVIPWFEDKSN